MTEPVEQKYCVVAYYARNGDIRQVSRFSDPAKAKKAVMQSQLTGQRAEVIASNLSLKDTKILMANHKEDFSIAKGTVAIPGLPKSKAVRAVKKPAQKIKTRTETNEHGTFEIRSTKISRFVC